MRFDAVPESKRSFEPMENALLFMVRNRPSFPFSDWVRFGFCFEVEGRKRVGGKTR